MNIQRAFTYFLEDEKWQTKIPLTIFLGVIPIINFVVIGWMLDLISNMLDGHEHPAPDWDNLGEVFMQRWVAGLMTAIAGILYALPLIVISVCLGIMFAVTTNEWLASALLSIIGIAYGAAIWLPLSVGMMRYAKTRDFNNYMQIGSNLQVARDNMETMFALIAFIVITSFLMTIFGRIPCIGWLFNLLTLGIGAIINGHLNGQAAVIIAQNIRGKD